MERADHGEAELPSGDTPGEQNFAGFIPALRSFFSRQTRNSQIIDDLVQDVMVRMHGRREATPPDNMHGYIFQTASSVLRDQFRRDRVRQIMITTDFTETDFPDVDCAPERVILAREEINLVVQALNELTERTRDIFLLRRYEGLSYGEIADRTGLSISALEKHVAKAAAHLARRIAR
jgi:RNA polymerase sigma-70 factor (ECF subfamily)